MSVMTRLCFVLSLASCLDLPPVDALKFACDPTRTSCDDGGSDTDAGTMPAPSCALSCSPPVARCVDTTLLLSFSLRGCSDNTCDFATTLTTCANGCDNNQCVGEPCAGVSCNAPPASECVDATTLKAYATPGACSAGACAYASSTIQCPSGCANGQCAGDPCLGKACTTPPASTCLNANTLRTFDASGVCGDGQCLYGTHDVACASGCSNGACNADPCAGMTCNAPPASTCLDATTLKVSAAPGTCNNGSCGYASTNVACPNGCAAGACVGDPCAGVTCTTPPSPVCLNATTLRTSTGGSCTNGGCQYASADATCAFGCAAGQCKPDPCVGVVCNAPPAASCADANTVRLYGAPGTCTAGSCVYGSSTTTCPGGCDAGACVGNPCLGVTCNAPPGPGCTSANNLQTFGSAGTCANGTCSYVPSNTICGAAEVCLDAGVASGCKWNEPSLSALTVSVGSLTFDGGQAYAVTVPVGTSSLAVTATLPMPTRATLTVNGASAVSGTGTPVTLLATSTTIPISVTAQSGATKSYTLTVTKSASADAGALEAYVKAHIPGSGDNFGAATALSRDGLTLAVGVPAENECTAGISHGNFTTTGGGCTDSGAVYIYVWSGTAWARQAYIKVANPVFDTTVGTSFGQALALSSDGNTLVVGEPFFGDAATGEHSDYEGRVSVYVRSMAGVWSLQDILGFTGTGNRGMNFGQAIAISDSGNVVIVGAPMALRAAPNPGAAYVFERTGPTWTSRFTFTGGNSADRFGAAVAISGDGNTVAIGSPFEDSATTGIGSTPNAAAAGAGAVYLSKRAVTGFGALLYVKPSNTVAGMTFGAAVSLDGAGETLAVGAPDTAAGGAAYVFRKPSSQWIQDAVVSPNPQDALDGFAASLVLTSDGLRLAVGAPNESSDGSSPANNNVSKSGAAYLFRRVTAWTSERFVKATNLEALDAFGTSVSLAENGRLAVGAIKEDSSAIGINGNQASNAKSNSGAVYVFGP